MQVANANEVPVIIYTNPVGINSGTHPFANIRKDLIKQLLIFGSLQIVFGALCIVFEAVSVGIFASYHHPSLAFVGYGFWIGILFIITGAFGCSGAKRSNKGLVITFNVLSIISASLTILLLILSISSACIYGLHPGYYYYYGDRFPYGIKDAGVAVESLMAIMGIAEAVVAIWSSVVCCKMGACCCDCGDACCCPPTLVPTQIVMMEQLHASQHPVVMYTVPADQQQVIMMNSQHPSNLSPQCQMVNPNIQPEIDMDFSEQTKLVM